jgi:hypothetical protein
MSSNPEQIPKSSESNIPIPHSGEYVSPEAKPIEAGIPAPNTAYEGFDELPPQDHERFAIDQGVTAVRQSHASTPESAPTKKNNRLKMLLGGVAAGVGVTIASAAVYVNAITSGIGIDNSQDKNRPPAPETSNSANPTPGQTGETQKNTFIETKFYDENGTETTKEELSESVRLTTDKYPDATDAMRGFFDKMEVMMNHFPSEAEVRNNLGYDASKKLTKEDYLNAAAIYRKAYDSIYENPNGKLYSEMNRLGASAVGYHYDTMNEAEPYRISIELPKGSELVLVTDNSTRNSVKDDPRTVRFSAYGGDAMERSIGSNGKQPAWMIPGNVDFKQLPN